MGRDPMGYNWDSVRRASLVAAAYWLMAFVSLYKAMPVWAAIAFLIAAFYTALAIIGFFIMRDLEEKLR